MMGFYHLGSFGSALDDVRINGSLTQELDSFQLSGFLLKDTNEFASDDLALLLRIRHIFQLSKKTLGSVHVDQIRMELVTEHLNHAFRFIFAHQAVVHMHAYQLLPDGPDQKRRHHGRIHAARQQ